MAKKQTHSGEPQVVPSDESGATFLDSAIARIQSAGFEVRYIGAGSDKVRKWAVHRPDSLQGYQPRSYFTREGLLAITSQHELRVDLADAIAAAYHRTPSKYLTIKKETENTMATKTTKTTTKKAATKKAAATKVATKKKAAAKKPAARKAKAISNDPDVQLLSTYQDKTIERMSAKAVVNIFRKINKATKAKPVVHATLSLYDKRLARELARLGLVNKADLPDIGLGYFPDAGIQKKLAGPTKAVQVTERQHGIGL